MTEKKVSRVPVPDIDTTHIMDLYQIVTMNLEKAQAAKKEMKASKTRAEHHYAKPEASERAVLRAVHYNGACNAFRESIVTYMAAYQEAVDKLPAERKARLERSSDDMLSVWLDGNYPRVIKPHRLFEVLHWMPEEDEAVPVAYLVIKVQLREQGKDFVQQVIPLLSDFVAEDAAGYNLVPEKLAFLEEVRTYTRKLYVDAWPEVRVTHRVLPADYKLQFVYG